MDDCILKIVGGQSGISSELREIWTARLHNKYLFLLVPGNFYFTVLYTLKTPDKGTPWRERQHRNSARV